MYGDLESGMKLFCKVDNIHYFYGKNEICALNDRELLTASQKIANRTWTRKIWFHNPYVAYLLPF